MKQLTRHHIIGRNAKMDWFDLHWNNELNNILKLKDSRHKSLHTLFGQANHPIAQYNELFNLTRKVIVDDVQNEIVKILRLLEEMWDDVYKKELIYH